MQLPEATIATNMEPLYIEPTTNTPKIHFDPVTGVFEMVGCSIPEDTVAFYQPVTSWLDSYLIMPEARVEVFHMKVDYFNTSSSKVLLDLLNTLNQLENNPRIHWYCKSYDGDMEDTARDFEAVLGCQIEIIKV